MMPNVPTLLMQVAVVIIAARLVGYLFRLIKQPQVVGEMAAGIILGPSVLGWMAPHLESGLFPPDSLGFLNALSQIGLVAFMFLVGLELNPRLMRGRGHTAVLTSHASITLPFLLGSVLAGYLYPRLSDNSVPFAGFALFLGISMSITAFPVLARILSERKLMHHPVGVIALACAAVDDVTAWCILAGVVAFVRASASASPMWVTFGGAIAYIVVMMFVVRPLLRGLEGVYRTRGGVTHDFMAVILLLVLASAWVTERLGIHALFGAFLVGAIMPKDPKLVREIRERIEGLVVVLLLPLFFAFTGLRMNIGLLSGSDMYFYILLIVGVAIAGKLGGSMVAARFSGMSWRDASAIGFLMNTRGLVQLVVLNIGLDIKVISPALFTMMVLMALVTTFMTTPLLEIVYPRRLFERESREVQAQLDEFDEARDREVVSATVSA